MTAKTGNGFPYWQFHSDRWLSGKISAFPLQDQGLFLQFCMAAWIAKGAFDIAHALVSRRFNLPSTYVEQTVEAMVECGILIEISGRYSIKFIDDQLAHMADKREKLSNAGKESAKAREKNTKKRRVKKRKEEKNVQQKLNICSTDDCFNQFWKAYPRKTGKDKAAESFAKRKADLPPIAELVAIVNCQKTTAQWTKDNGEFIPHPATWLNQGRWQDEAKIEVAASRKSSTGLVNTWRQAESEHVRKMREAF